MGRRWDKYHEILEAKRAEVAQELRRKRSQMALEPGGDMLDRLRSLAEREFAVRTVNRLSVLLDQVDAALDRLREGTFGICQNCGRQVSPRRLAALPWTALCIECQEDADRREPEAA